MTKIDPYLHAALLLKGADKEISEAHIVSVLKAAGLEADGQENQKIFFHSYKKVDMPEKAHPPCF